MLVLDQSAPLMADDRDLLATTESAERILVANKADLGPAWDVAVMLALRGPRDFSENGRGPRGAAKSAARSDDVQGSRRVMRLRSRIFATPISWIAHA